NLAELTNYEKEDINLEERKKTLFLNDKGNFYKAKTALRFNEQGFNDRMEEMVGLGRSLEAQESELGKV
ncbi:11440_t:CDS:2, partial [Funneliformis caledonium]